MESEGQNIRNWYQRRLPSDPSKDYYFIHRLTGNTEPVLIEYGFVDNEADANYIKNNWQKLAEAVVRAVSVYKNLPYDGTLNEVLYTVRPGDSLTSIANRYGTTIDVIKDINGLTTNIISVGDQLIIPKGTGEVITTTTTTYDTYTVRSGDSLYSIANRYNTTVAEIKNLNNLTSNLLSIGQVLRIPGTGETSTTTTTAETYDTYTVRSGDNLYSIANRYNTTVDQIKALNNLTNNLLSIGQVLRIPRTLEIITDVEPETDNIYIVQSGDSLYSLARTYNTTVNQIKTLNNLTSDVLSIGQQLIIPTASLNVYTVKSGDSLYAIARQYNTTVAEIKSLNNLSGDLLSIGQQLIIPN